MESSLFSDTLYLFPSFSKPQLLPNLIPRSPNLPISICSRSFAAAATATATATAVNMDSTEVKLLGGRFMDAVEKLTESTSFDNDLYKHDITGSRAHASMLARQGLITEDDKNSILKGLDEIEGQIERGEFVRRTEREDVHMNIEAALTDLVGEPAEKLHTARSRNDQVCTDFRLWCRDAIDNIVMRVKQLQVVLGKLALKNEGLIVPGYTHLQRAQPVLVQHLLLGYVEQLARDAARLLDCRERMNFCPLSACALAGTGLLMTSEALGFIAPIRNRENKDKAEGSNKDNDEGSSGEGNSYVMGSPSQPIFYIDRPNADHDERSNEDNDDGSGGRGNGIRIRTFSRVGLVIGGVVGLYLVYKTGQTIEREIVGALREWKDAGFPPLVKISIEKVGVRFSIY